MELKEICKFIDDFIEEDAKDLEVIKDELNRTFHMMDHFLLLTLLKTSLIAKYSKEDIK